MTKPSNDLLSQLGSVAREQLDEDDPPALRALVEGSLAAEEQSALEARAKTDEALAFALKTHTPLGADVREALVSKLAAERKAAKKPRTARLWLGTLGIAAAAAAAALMLVRAPDTALPEYRLLAQGGTAETRSEADAQGSGIEALAPDARLSLVLRPIADTAGDSVALLFLRDGARTTILDVVFARAPSGAYRAEVSAATLAALGPARARLLALVCAPSACDDVRSRILRGETPQSPHARTLWVDYALEASPR